MGDTVSPTVWYGELRTSKGNATIIRDEQLSVAERGRVYLYNTERDAIVQYDEAKVSRDPQDTKTGHPSGHFC